MPDRGRFALANDLRLSCMRISRRVRFESAGEIAPHQFSVLCRLECGALTPRRLAEIERVSAPSMTRTVGGLADRGLVARSADPDDGRQVLVTLTPAGAAVLAATRSARDAWMIERIERLTDDELDVLAAAAGILTKVADA